MPLTLGKNIASLTAQRKLGESSAALSKVFERLSTGLRVNRAADDAAGLALASTLRADSRILGQATRNINDAISAVSIAQSAMESLSALLERQTELATQAANGVYSAAQRKAMNTEAQALVSEFNRIVQTTSFNNKNLLNGSTTSLTIQAGSGAQNAIALNLPTLTASSMGVGDGSFQSVVSYLSGTDPKGVATGDFNGDGVLDIVVTDYTNNKFAILLNNGSGTFNAAVSYNAYSNPAFVATADLNGDGFLDVVTGNNNFTGASVAFGNGNGTFRAQISYGTTGDSHSIELVDLNGDGAKDIVVGGGNSTNYIGVMLNNGNGTFAAERDYTVGAINTQAPETAFGDVNGDGKLDILTTIRTGGAMSVLLGNGNGTFLASTTYSMGGGASGDIALLDVNNDSILDAIVTDSTANKLVIRLGNGNGTFKVATSSALGITGTRYLQTGDFNGDSKTDLIIAGEYTNNVVVLLANGDGTFKINQTLSTSAATKRNSISVGDFNGDGISDFVIGAYGSSSGGTDSVNVFIGSGSSTTGVLNLSYSLLTQSGARSAISMLQTSRESLQSSMGNLGAQSSRLSFAYSLVTTQRQNYLAAEASISDADMAFEAAQMVRLKILQQTGSAILAQANQQSSLVLSLLR